MRSRWSASTNARLADAAVLDLIASKMQNALPVRRHKRNDPSLSEFPSRGGESSTV